MTSICLDKFLSRLVEKEEDIERSSNLPIPETKKEEKQTENSIKDEGTVYNIIYIIYRTVPKVVYSLSKFLWL